MIPFLLAAPSRRHWTLPPWLTPEPEQVAVLLVRVLLTLITAWVAQRLLFLFVKRLEHWLVRASRDSSHGIQRARTIGQLLRNAITALVTAYALVHMLAIFGWDVKPLLVGASILGAALGFGAQFLVRDIIAGTFIFTEDQFVVGDTIEVNGVAATVEAVTLRSTRLRDFRGREMHVPNGEMKIVINHSRGWQRAVLDLPLAPGQDLARALRVSEAVVAELNNDVSWRDLLMDPFVVMGLERVGPDGAVLRVVGRARPGGDAPRLAREARLRLLQRWRDEGIQTNVEANPASRRGPEPNAPSAPSES